VIQAQLTVSFPADEHRDEKDENRKHAHVSSFGASPAFLEVRGDNELQQVSS
jgi:hypothetical protein